MNHVETTALKKVPREKPARLKDDDAVILVTGNSQRRFAAWESLRTVAYFMQYHTNDCPVAYVPTLDGYKVWSETK